eukprot:TRINITY_DN39332_c0_g1_i1.p1 TRINITY_DN39332_c0_g1~~TRINITY_DN39332_c0_g1_i1.p1  ORF type:complete len:220 (+),score=32.06 TRINITY_DN39332_c0_g1_i1:61-720(+)
MNRNAQLAAAGAGATALCGALYCCFCRSGSGSATQATTRDVRLPAQRVYQRKEIESGCGVGFRVDVPAGWMVEENTDHGATVFKFCEQVDEDQEEGEGIQPVLLILEKLPEPSDEQLGVQSYAMTAKQGTVDQLAQLGTVEEATVEDDTTVLSGLEFVQWQLTLHTDQGEDPAINMWSGVSIYGGYAWAFQICGGVGFEPSLKQARQLASSLVFLGESE